MFCSPTISPLYSFVWDYFMWICLSFFMLVCLIWDFHLHISQSTLYETSCFFPLFILPYMRPLAFYVWYYVMLLALKENNTTGTFYLCHLLHVLCMIIKSDAICTCLHLWTLNICTDGVAVYLCPCILLASACVIDYQLFVSWLHNGYIYWYCKLMDKSYICVHVLHYHHNAGGHFFVWHYCLWWAISCKH